jgi:hypothetical protein
MQHFPQKTLVVRISQLFLFVTAALLFSCPVLQAGDWPQFRGPGALGISDEKGLPTVWGGPEAKNIIWKTPLIKADNGFSSPIVCNGRVFLTVAVNKPVTHTVLCFEEAHGKLLLQTDVEPGP